MTPNPRQQGAVLEDVLQWQHNTYRANNLAVVWHNGTKSEVRGGKVIMLQSRPDFEGCLTCQSGRHVAFDSKHVTVPEYRHDSRRRHQLRDLWEVHEAGGIAFLLVSVRLESYYLLWPTYEWRDEQPYHVKLDQLAAWEGEAVPIAGGYQLPDWLAVVTQRGKYNA